MRLGLGLWIGDALNGSSGPLDPSSLVLTGWWRASYGGSPWAGTASAGASGSRSLSEATNPPAVGAALNGLTPADFDGDNDVLSSATAYTSYVSEAAGSMACLFFARTAAEDAGVDQHFANPALIADADAFMSLAFCDEGVRFTSVDTEAYGGVVVPCATGGWHAAIARWNAEALELSVDGGEWETLPFVTSLVGSTGGLRVGANWDASVTLDGLVAESLTAQVRWSDAQSASVLAAMVARYGVPA